MSSEAQLAANRANAQLSTGPKTPEGKQTVAKNRITHGLTGRAVLIPGENPEDFERLASQLKFELAPGNHVEEALVQRIANLQWRLNRVAEWTGQLTTECLQGDPEHPSRLVRMFSKTSDPCDAFERLHAHEASLSRQHQAALRELRLSKEERSKIMTGKNPAALCDIEQLVNQTTALLTSLGIPVPEAVNSNPISSKTDLSKQATRPELSESANTWKALC
jgi:hypothetical protein